MHVGTNMAKYDSYVICTSPRSGSTLLCNLLAVTGVAGRPESYFHHPSISDWLAYLGITPDVSIPERGVLRAVFRSVIAKGSLETGVFGMRLQRHSFKFFSKKLAVLYQGLPNDLRRFEAAFGRTLFVHLTRENKVDQAVSYVRAHQTGLWHRAPDGTELERLSPPREPYYDADEIRTQFDEMIALDHEWESWFTSEGIDPLRITYGSLSADPIGTVRSLLNHLGLNREAANGVEPGVAKLADEINEEWAARFCAERDVAGL
jgi:LPS sulfotransferase NodH